MGGWACNGVHIGLMKLILFAKCLKNQEITLRIKGTKGMLVSNLIIFLEGMESWRFTAVFQQLLTISRFSVSGEVGPWLLPLNYCGCGEDLEKMPFTSSLWSVHHTFIYIHNWSTP